MKFSTLAGMTGGGQQTPGFIGVGKAYISSRKFISAEGGHKRIVWMPQELKETLKEELAHIGEQLGNRGLRRHDRRRDRGHRRGIDSAASWRRWTIRRSQMWDITQPSPNAAGREHA